MGRQKTERMEKAVRAEMMRLLRERVKDPTMKWIAYADAPEIEYRAGSILKNGGLLNEYGYITLPGMDYYRRETKPIRTWLRSNWFAVIVAGCTIGVSVWGIAGG